ncbi:MAG TPA: gliding motility-associated C-terminal domain-containing protein [Saprospiraceae bacterium]|nr:gliding motility-associated C-terminal domain-containing protein [Saprospiraceae bacterium]
MRHLLVLFLFSCGIASLWSQPLQFVDRADSVRVQSLDVAADDNGGWLTVSELLNGRFKFTLFDYCGKIVQTSELELPVGSLATRPQVLFLGKGRFLVSGLLQEGPEKRVLLFFYDNGSITQARRFGVEGATEYRNPLISVSSINNVDQIFCSFQYANAATADNSRLMLLDPNLNLRWSRQIPGESQVRWMRMARMNELLVGEGNRVMRFDTTGKNIWTRQLTDLQLMSNSAIQDDTLLVFSTDYVDPVPDTGAIKRPLYKQVVCLDQLGNLIWNSVRIRALRVPYLAESNSRLMFNNQKGILLNSLDTLNGDSIPAFFAHHLDSFGKLVSSKYWSALDSVLDYRSVLLSDGNFGVSAALGSERGSRHLLNAKTSQQYEACSSLPFSSLVNRPIQIQNLGLSDLVDSTTQVFPMPLRTNMDSLKLLRVCEKFDLKDGEIPTPLCKGDSVFIAGIMIPNATYEWSNGGNQSGTWVKEEGTYLLKITYCEKTVTITYKVFYISFSDETINEQKCTFPYRLNAFRGDDATYLWASGQTTSFLDVNGPGTYTVNVTKCQTTFKINFIVSLETFADQEFEVKDSCANFPVPLSAVTSNADSYRWNTGQTTQSIEAPKPGTYVVDIRFCQQSYKNTFIVSQLEKDIVQFPNVFPPNSEIVMNKTFGAIVKNPAVITEFKLEIYNRWGQNVFSSNSVNQVWDGNYKGAPAPVDTYMFFASFKTACGLEESIKGPVTLIR